MQFFLEIRGQDIKPFIFGNIYRSPKNDNSSVQGFLREFSPIITDLCKDNKNIILSGDFNLNLILANQRELYGQFLDLLLSLGLCPKITYPTHFAKYSASLLDLIFVRTNNGLLSTTNKANQWIRKLRPSPQIGETTKIRENSHKQY